MAGTISDAWMNPFFLSMETGQYEQSKFILLLTQRYEDLLRHCHDLKKYTRWGEGGWDTWAGQFCKWCKWCQERRVGCIEGWSGTGWQGCEGVRPTCTSFPVMLGLRLCLYAPLHRWEKRALRGSIASQVQGWSQIHGWLTPEPVHFASDAQKLGRLGSQNPKIESRGARLGCHRSMNLDFSTAENCSFNILRLALPFQSLHRNCYGYNINNKTA